MQLSPKVLLVLMLLGGLAPPLLAQEPLDGARLADACSSCHGLDGAGGEAIPPIVGLGQADFVARMLAFRDQTAPATIMNRLARGYTDAEITALADYFHALEAK